MLKFRGLGSPKPQILSEYLVRNTTSFLSCSYIPCLFVLLQLTEQPSQIQIVLPGLNPWQKVVNILRSEIQVSLFKVSMMPFS